MGSSLADLRAFPAEVRRAVGGALLKAQWGGVSGLARPMKGFGGGATVMEIVDSFAGNAYRVIYTVKLRPAVYVLHAFQKKSKKGIKTPAADILVIERRLAEARRHYAAFYETGGSR